MKKQEICVTIESELKTTKKFGYGKKEIEKVSNTLKANNNRYLKTRHICLVLTNKNQELITEWKKFKQKSTEYKTFKQIIKQKFKQVI